MQSKALQWSHKLSNVRSTIPLNGLTPGTTYAFQARAYGTAGYTDLTDSAPRMCA
jgi:hypothetical protein